jgi:hypothetical protein
MKSTPLVNMSVDGFLGVGVRPYNASGDTDSNASGDTDSKASAGPLIGGVTGGFIIFVFACIAATHSNSDSIYSACGHTLRNFLIAGLVLPSILIVVVLLVALVALLVGWKLGSINSQVGTALKSKEEVNAALKSAVNTSITVLIFLSLCSISFAVGAACLGGFSISESVIAMGNSDCMSAMSNTTDGINSPSANTGSPLLAIMAVVQGIGYCFTALGFTMGFVISIVYLGAACFASNH